MATQQSTVEILSNISKTVSAIANSVAPQNGKGDVMKKLSNGNIAAETTDGTVKPKNLTSVSLKEFLAVMGGLPIAVKAVAGLYGKTMKSFKGTMISLTDIMESVNKAGSKMKKENIENVLNPIKNLADIIKSFGKISLLVPVAIIGIKMTKMFVKGIISIIEMIGNHDFKKETKSIGKLIGVIKPLQRMVTMSILLVGLCMGLGAVVAMGGGKLILGGLAVLGMTYVALMGIFFVVGMMGKFIKSIGVVQGVNSIIKLTLLSIGVVAICIALGALLTQGPALKILFAGLGVLLGTYISLGIIIFLAGYIGRVAGSKATTQGLINIGAFVIGSIFLIALAVGLGALMSGQMMKMYLFGMGMILINMGVIFLMTRMARKVGAAVRHTIKNFALMMACVYGACGLVYAFKYAGEYASKHMDSILLGYTAAALVILGVVGLSMIAKYAAKICKDGMVAMLAIEGLAVGAIAIVFLASHLADRLEGRWGSTLGALGMVALVLAGIGVIAAVAGTIAEFIIAGSVAIGLAELMMLGAIGLMHKVITLDKTMDESGVTWGAIRKDVAQMALVVGGFGLLAAAFSVLTIPIMLALPAIAITLGMINGVIFTMSRLAILTNVMQLTGVDKIKKTLSEDIPSIMSMFTYKNLNPGMNALEVAALWVKYGFVTDIARGVLEVAETISKLANLGQMTENGLRPILSINKETGEIKYGEPVDLRLIATTICDVIKTFTSTMSYGIHDVIRMQRSAQVMELLGSMTKPISTFIEMLTGYVGGTNGAGEYTLTPVHVTSDGKIRYGAPVNVKDTANSIANAVSTFVGTLFSEDNASRWSQLVYGDRNWWQKMWGKTNDNVSSIKEIGGMLGLFVDPVSKFIDLISKYESRAPGHLSIVRVDKNGKPYVEGDIDVAAISKAMSDGVSLFIEGIFNIPTDDDTKEKAASVAEVVKCVGSVSKALGDLSQNKTIDTKKLEKLYVNFDRGAASLKRVTKQIATFDKFLYKDAHRRRKTIEDLSKNIKTLLASFKDESNGAKVLLDILNKLDTMSVSDIGEKVQTLRGGSYATSGYTAPSPYIPGANNGGSGGGSGLSADDVIKAIREALDGIRVYGADITDEKTHPGYGDVYDSFSLRNTGYQVRTK